MVDKSADEITRPGPATEAGMQRDGFDDFLPDAVLSEEIEDGRGAAILAYLPFGCFVALVRHRDNAFAVRHGKQGLLLTFAELLAGLFLIPRLSEYFWVTIVFACLASAVTGIYYALQGREWSIPVVGEWFEKRIQVNKYIRDDSDLD
jgi:uncharacterized membrane protein